MPKQLEIRRTVAPIGQKFKPALIEGLMADGDVDKLIHRFRYINPNGVFGRFVAARDSLREFGGSIGLVTAYGGVLRIAAKLEILTDHLKLDEELHSLVVGMGFDLRLQHNPQRGSMEHVYVLTEGKSHSVAELSSLPDISEDLVRLAIMLKPYVRLLEPNDGVVVHLADRRAA